MRILIVDDSTAMRMIVRRVLRQAFPQEYVVEEACNGLEALKAIRANSPDLVLSDWNMPEMSGIDLLTSLRSDGLNVRFGFVTSEGTAEMRQRAKDAGALFLIAKPFTAETFQATLAPTLAGAA